MNKQAGFTIIELVVVIALLGILSAVALPRFIDVTDDANAAAVEGTAGALQAGVALVKAQAVVDDVADGDNVDFDGVNVEVNATRFPAATDADECVTVWDSVLQGGRPSVETGANADGDSDYGVAFNNDQCVFTYVTTIGANANAPTITYDPEDGSVTTANID